jgi:hypothetical protein
MASCWRRGNICFLATQEGKTHSDELSLSRSCPRARTYTRSLPHARSQSFALPPSLSLSLSLSLSSYSLSQARRLLHKAQKRERVIYVILEVFFGSIRLYNSAAACKQIRTRATLTRLGKSLRPLRNHRSHVSACGMHPRLIGRGALIYFSFLFLFRHMPYSYARVTCLRALAECSCALFPERDATHLMQRYCPIIIKLECAAFSITLHYVNLI